MFSAPTPKVQVLTIAFCCYFRRFWPRMYEYQNSLVDLANRIAQLEDALRVSHGRYSNEPHPLLDEDQLRIKEPFLRQVRQSSDPSISSPGSHQATSDGTGLDELTVSLDTFSVSELGRSNYIGPAAWTNVGAFLGRVPFKALCLQPSIAPKGSESTPYVRLIQLTCLCSLNPR
jgi:hypothetical protein